MEHAAEVGKKERFEFGKNWARFLKTIDSGRIEEAKESLLENLGDIRGLSFIDVGSGSGLFSLAAHLAGASVHSFDYDPQSVACTENLRKKYAKNTNWTIEQGSVLDKDYLSRLGAFDIVYSWGVLHHTGNMRQAFENVINLVSQNGRLWISIYNDQGWKSRYWRFVKKTYNSSRILRALLHIMHAPVLIAGPIIYRAVTGKKQQLSRGMSRWHDYLDWIGGYPYEFASVSDLQHFFETRGFRVESINAIGNKIGCNEILFRKN